MEKNAVGGSRCLQCAAKQKPSESATGVSERADRSAVQIHSAGRAGKGVSQEIVEASNSCRGNLQSLRSFARLNGKTWQATCRRIVLALLVVANPAAVQRSPNHLFFQFGDSILKAICRRTKIVCFAAKLVRFS